MIAQKKGVQQLRKEVHDANACTSCGMCVGLCPYIKASRDRISIIHDCGRSEGRCYQVCPRGETDLAALEMAVFQKPRRDHALGSHASVLMARSLVAAARDRGQYGGVVSTLAILARESKLVDGLVMTGGPVPKGRVAYSNEDILACAGSKYGAAPSMEALNVALATTESTFGVVGRPCQITAARKRQALPGEPDSKRISLTIGLFCFWALSYKFYDFLAQLAPLSTILKVDLPPGSLVLETTNGKIVSPIDDIRSYIKPACDNCFDVTSELADVSVGATEFDPEWNTLIPRTQRGEDLVNKAVANGLLEVKPLPSERVEILRQVVLAKKRRVLGAADKSKIDYLMIGDEYRNPVLEKGESL